MLEASAYQIGVAALMRKRVDSVEDIRTLNTIVHCRDVDTQGRSPFTSDTFRNTYDPMVTKALQSISKRNHNLFADEIEALNPANVFIETLRRLNKATDAAIASLPVNAPEFVPEAVPTGPDNKSPPPMQNDDGIRAHSDDA